MMTRNSRPAWACVLVRVVERAFAAVLALALLTFILDLGVLSASGQNAPGSPTDSAASSQQSTPQEPSADESAHKHKIKPYALIFGTVFDVHDRTVPGVKIRMRRATDKKPKWDLISDARGEFAQRVPAGAADYLVWAEIKGKKGPVAETKVHVDNDERQDIGLHLPE